MRDSLPNVPKLRRSGDLKSVAIYCLFLGILARESSQYNTTCPIGCYKCVVDTPKGFETLRSNMPKSVRKMMLKDSGAKKNVILNPPVTCEGCWAEHLGTAGCPPVWV